MLTLQRGGSQELQRLTAGDHFAPGWFASESSASAMATWFELAGWTPAIRDLDWGAASHMEAESTAGSFGVASGTHPGKCYNEEAFRYFLSIERKRAARAKRCFFLLQVSARDHLSGTPVRIAPATAERLWPVLWLCVRDVDFVGWYRTGTIAGAVLTQGAGSPARDIATLVVERVTEALQDRLPSRLSGTLRVRVLEIRPKFKG